MADDIGVAVVTYLEAESNIGAYVGSGSAARIYPDVVAQEATLPAIRYEVVSTVSAEDVGGASGIAQSRVRLDCYSKTRLQANEMAETLRASGGSALQNYRGTMGAHFVHGSSVESGPIYLRDAPRDGSDNWRYITRTDFMITYTQTV